MEYSPRNHQQKPLEKGTAMRKNSKINFRYLFTMVLMPFCLFLIAAEDCDEDGFDTTVDCNDEAPAINPGAVETGDRVDSPDGIIPAYNPLGLELVDINGARKFVVQEHTTGRVSILTEN